MDLLIKLILIFNGEQIHKLINHFNKHLYHQNGERKQDIFSGKIFPFDEKLSKNSDAIFLLPSSNSMFSVIMRNAEVQLSVQHQLPVLLYEAYPIKIQIKNRENIDIHSAM